MSESSALTQLPTAHGPLALPAFLPDATRGAVRGVDAADLVCCGVSGLVVNTLHLIHKPGGGLVEQLGGIHRFMGWDGPIASDSGGFQVYSLLAQSGKHGAVTEAGFSYRLEKGGEKESLSPEECIRRQFQLGADILYCLDHCTHASADGATQRESVEHTVAWARAGKEEWRRRVEQRDGPRPLLFAVVQGGNDRTLRRECAERLLEIGFDGYGFGGWPIDGEGRLIEMVEYVAGLLPRAAPLHALGIGKPENLVAAWRAGYHLFDCVLPTRDARHKRLYVFTGRPQDCLGEGDFYEYLYLSDERFARDGRPLEAGCDCPTCARHSRAYLHHLFRSDEALAARLCTLHNLRFYTRLMQALAAHGRG